MASMLKREALLVLNVLDLSVELNGLELRYLIFKSSDVQYNIIHTWTHRSKV